MMLDQVGFHHFAKRYEMLELRERFQRQSYLCLPKVISPALLRTILRRLEKTDYALETMEAGSELAPQQTRLHLDISTIFWEKDFLSFIGEITQKGPFDVISTRIYRMDPDSEQHFDWHSDSDGKRLVGLSLNLSENIFHGGEFQIRDLDKADYLTHANTGLGDLLLFDISDQKVHRVAPVTGKFPKIAYAGWLEKSS